MMAPSFSMTRTWEHDRMTREIERVTGKATDDWFRVLDRGNARRMGVVRAIEWLEANHTMPHRLASTLVWNYFNPSTLPCDVAVEIDEGHQSEELKALHPEVEARKAPVRARAGLLARAALHATGRRRGAGKTGERAARRGRGPERRSGSRRRSGR